MLRSLFRRLVASASQTLDRGRIDRPGPQLEAMEDRSAPSALGPLPKAGALAPQPTNNLPSVSGAGVRAEERSGEQGQPHSGASDSDHAAGNSDPADGASAISSKDLVFQGPHNRAGCGSVTVCKDQVFQGLPDSRYLIWVTGNLEALPESDTPPDPFFALADNLQTIEWAVMTIANASS